MSVLTKMRGIAGSLVLLTAVFVGSAVETKADAINCCTVGGTELTNSGSGSLGGILTISATPSGGNTIFTITMAPPTGGNYTASAFVSNIYFNVTGTPGGTTTYTVANTGITCTNCGAIDSSGLAVTVGNNNQGQGSFTGFDGHIDLPPPPGGAATLGAGETITFTVVGLTGVDLCNAFNTGGFSLIAHIQGLGANGEQSGWYTCTDCGGAPVPEPASMLLLGTGLLGVAGAARRRFRKPSQP